VPDPGRLSTQYQRSRQAASAIDRAVEELKSSPAGQVEHDSIALGRYLASVAGLIDPALAGEVDPDFANTVPRALVANLAARRRGDRALAHRLLTAARALEAGRTLERDQVELVQDVADVAAQDALQRSREILAP
jgi:hypothetical protein